MTDWTAAVRRLAAGLAWVLEREDGTGSSAGFVRSLLTVMRTSLDAPDHTTLSRRGQVLNVAVHNILITGPLHLIIDSTGLSVVVEGEWAATHVGGGTRGWKKLHLGVDRPGMIVAHALTEAPSMTRLWVPT